LTFLCQGVDESLLLLRVKVRIEYGDTHTGLRTEPEQGRPPGSHFEKNREDT
jgi:hypothetical protein